MWRWATIAVVCCGLIGAAYAGLLPKHGVVVASLACPTADGSEVDSGSTGAVCNAYGTWTLGPAEVPATLAGPPGPFGPMRYVKLNGKPWSGNNDVLFSQGIRIDFGGKVFFLTSQNDRIEYAMGGYNATVINPGADPPNATFTGSISGTVLTVTSGPTLTVGWFIAANAVPNNVANATSILSLGPVGPPAQYNLSGSAQTVPSEVMAATSFGGVPPWWIVPANVDSPTMPASIINSPVSADGTVRSGGTGTLITQDGTWSFGTGTGNWPIQLNGIALVLNPGSSNIDTMEVSTQGTLFARSISNAHWYAYLNWNWYDMGTTVPAGPIPIEVNLSVNLIDGPVTSSTPIGTTVATVAVRMSDGSTFIPGTTGTLSMTSTATTPVLGLSGSNINVTATPIFPTSEGYTVTVTVGGVSVSAGTSRLGLRVLS